MAIYKNYNQKIYAKYKKFLLSYIRFYTQNVYQLKKNWR